MAELEGFLSISDEFGNCVELLNDCRTLAYLDSANLKTWTPTDVCDDCCCESICGDNYTTPELDNAPWYDDLNPASNEFYGLSGSLRIDQPPPSDGIVPAKTLTFTGILTSGSTRGKAYGMAWLDRALSPLCTSCTGREATVFAYCPGRCDESATPQDGDDGLPVTPVAPAPLDLSDLFDADGCEVDGSEEPIPPSTPAEALDDTGQRDLLSVQYVAGSLQEIESEFPQCFGCRITFQFTLNDSESFLDGTPICTITPPADGDADVPARCPRIVTEVTGDIESCGVCGPPCDCTPTLEVTTVDTPAANVMPDGAAECRYSAPLQCKRYACLTETFASTTAAPVLSVYAGSEDLSNVTVSIYEATAGIPNIMTELGQQIYNARTPISCAMISRIPAGATVTLDARNNSERLQCPGFTSRSASPLVSGGGGSRYRHPRLCCGLRYWIVIEVDCVTTGHDDWSLTGAIHGAERA